MYYTELFINILILVVIASFGLTVIFSDPILDGYFICDYCNENGPGPETYRQGVTSTVCPRCNNEMRREDTMP